ncbi:MAG: hypothetical protein WCS32_05560 [Candidatus Izemoplasmatales bacterium]
MEFCDGFDLGFEEGSWHGYLYAIDKLKEMRFRRESLIVAGTIAVSIPLTVLGIKLYNDLKSKNKHKSLK